MKRRLPTRWQTLSLLCGMLLLLHATLLTAQAPAAAVDAFQAYSKEVEARIAQHHRSAEGFLAWPPGDRRATAARLRDGALIIESLTPTEAMDLPGAMLHHWRGTAFAAGATANDFELLMRNFRAYPQHFAPEVLAAGVTTQNGDRLQTWMRVRQQHVITVVLDANYDVTFGQLDGRHGYSLSRSTRIEEIDGAGTKAERVLGAREEHGFLWRLNTYWSYEERDGGLYLQLETVSLSRSIPYGLGWAIKPYVESVPRESLAFTLRSACEALEKRQLTTGSRK